MLGLSEDGRGVGDFRNERGKNGLAQGGLLGAQGLPPTPDSGAHWSLEEAPEAEPLS